MTPLKHSSQSGVTLLLALFIVFGILGASVVISGIMLNEIRSTADTSSSVAAYYGAESIVERQSFEIKQARLSQQSFDTAFTRMTALSRQSYLDGNVQASSEEETKELDVFETYVLKDRSVQLDLFDPDELNGGIEEVRLWGRTTSGWLEITLSAVDSAGQPVDLIAPKLLLGPSEINGGYRLQGLVGTYNYRLRLKALYDLVHDLSIQPYGSGGNPATIKGVLGFEASARFGNDVERNLTVVHPWTVPASGLFDFGIFSEGQIKK